MDIDKILIRIPTGLRNPLIAEYKNINQHYLERRWTASELSGGKFCEIVYTILQGYASGNFSAQPSKPSNFLNACRNLENGSASHIPRSFKILIPRMLPPLYEIRNNRNVGHVGGDVDPNFMDSNVVIAMCSWIMGELIRVFHDISTDEAQKAVDLISSRKTPLIWETGQIKRVLNTSMSVKDQILLLLISNSGNMKVTDLDASIENSDKKYFKKLLRNLHKDRLIELSSNELEAEISPLGVNVVEKVITKLM